MTREEYIDFANALKNNYTIDFDKLPEFCDMAISALSDKWIPVSERLPENSDYVLFSDIDNDVMVGYHNPNYQKATHFTEKGSWEDMKNVVAWQPLPEPYKENEA